MTMIMNETYSEEGFTQSAKLPSTPPPSLATTTTLPALTMTSDSSDTTTSTRYDRSSLLALSQTSPQSLPPSKSRRLSSFSPILRRNGRNESVVSISDSDEWGVDESISSILDNQPISKYLPIPIPITKKIQSCDLISISSSTTNNEEKEKEKEVLFNFSSIVSDGGLPVMIDFKNPFEDALIQAQINSSPSPPSSVHVGGQDQDKDGKSSSPGIHKSSIAVSRGKSNTTQTQTQGSEVNALGLSLSSHITNPNNQKSRFISPSPPQSIRSSRGNLSTRSSFSATTGEKLNPFAPPFYSNTAPSPFPTFGHKIPSTITNESRRSSLSPAAAAVTASLPAPKAKLPAKPGPLPPIFIKRESAALPQPMALPGIEPLGESWQGENSLSGNDKRRRASLIQTSLPLTTRGSSNSLTTTPNSSPEVRSKKLDVIEQRPERLVMLGKKLRDSISSSSSSSSSNRNQVEA